MQGLSYLLSALGLISTVCALITKGEKFKTVLFFVFCGNMLVAVSYLVGGKGINGAASCCLGSVQTLINYFFNSKNKPLPHWLAAVYITSITALNIWVAHGVTFLGLLVIATGVAFVISIFQKNGAQYRIWVIITTVIWCLYDVLSGSYSVLLTHVPLLGVAVVSAWIHDRPSKKKNDTVSAT